MDFISFSSINSNSRFVSNCDVRLKIVFFLIFSIIIFSFSAYENLLLILFLLIALILLDGFPALVILKGIKGFSYFLIITFLANLLFTPGKILFDLWLIRPTIEGLSTGILVSMKFILVIIGSMILTFTTSIMDFVKAFNSLLKPLKKIKIPVDNISLTLAMSLRFLPLIFRQSEKIRKTQIIRGSDFKSRNILKKIHSLFSLFVPLLINSFLKSEEMALAMEARCFKIGEERSKGKVKNISANNWIAFILLIIGLIAIRQLDKGLF